MRVSGRETVCLEQETEWPALGWSPERRPLSQGLLELLQPAQQHWIQDMLMWFQFSSGHKLFMFQKS